MHALAVDVVLLPSDDLSEAAIALNRSLSGVIPQPIVLSRTDGLPHVSLAMGCVSESQVPALANALDTIAAAHAPVDVRVAGLHVRASSQANAPVTSLEIVRTPALQALHEAAMRALAPHITPNAAADMFVDPAAVTPSTLRWVNEYATAASFARFWPHITLGMGTLPDGTRLPRAGTASRLALCHLGPHCTCRRVLFETPLRGG